MSTLKAEILSFLSGIFKEPDENGKSKHSIGKWAFWLVFIPALVIWISGVFPGIKQNDIVENHLNVLMLLMAYNFGKKINDTVKNIWSAKQITNIPTTPNDAPPEKNHLELNQ